MPLVLPRVCAIVITHGVVRAPVPSHTGGELPGSLRVLPFETLPVLLVFEPVARLSQPGIAIVPSSRALLALIHIICTPTSAVVARSPETTYSSLSACLESDAHWETALMAPRNMHLAPAAGSRTSIRTSSPRLRALIAQNGTAGGQHVCLIETIPSIRPRPSACGTSQHATGTARAFMFCVSTASKSSVDARDADATIFDWPSPCSVAAAADSNIDQPYREKPSLAPLRPPRLSDSLELVHSRLVFSTSRRLRTRLRNP